VTDQPTLRGQYAAVLTAAAHDCDGTCGLSEQDCYDAHPITWFATSNGATHIVAAVAAVADTVAAVRDEEMATLRDALGAVETIAARWEKYGSADLRTAARILRTEVLAQAEQPTNTEALYDEGGHPICICTHGERCSTCQAEQPRIAEKAAGQDSADSL
jgi:hypothetical protein